MLRAEDLRRDVMLRLLERSGRSDEYLDLMLLVTGAVPGPSVSLLRARGFKRARGY